MGTPNWGQARTLAKRRGYVFQSSEIYGGAASGGIRTAGLELKRKVKEAGGRHGARRETRRPRCRILMHPKVGRPATCHFTIRWECLNCHQPLPRDTLLSEQAEGACRAAVLRLRHERQVDTSPEFNLLFKPTRAPPKTAEVGTCAPRRAGDYGLPEREQSARQGCPSGSRSRKGFERDHPRELHLPHARVRADGDAVLREARHRRGVVRPVAREAAGLAPRGDRAGPRAHPLRAAREAGALCQRRGRRGVLLRRQHRRRGVGRDRGDPQPHRLRPQPPPGVQRQADGVHRPRGGRAVHAVHHRDQPAPTG